MYALVRHLLRFFQFGPGNDPPLFSSMRRSSDTQAVENGLILTDVANKKWIVGLQIGAGGFGKVFEAASSSAPCKMNYVIKVVRLRLLCIEKAVQVNEHIKS